MNSHLSSSESAAFRRNWAPIRSPRVDRTLLARVLQAGRTEAATILVAMNPSQLLERAQAIRRTSHGIWPSDAVYVLIYQGDGHGWTNTLDRAAKVVPGTYAVSRDGEIYEAHGGSKLTGAKRWKQVQAAPQR